MYNPFAGKFGRDARSGQPAQPSPAPTPLPRRKDPVRARLHVEGEVWMRGGQRTVCHVLEVSMGGAVVSMTGSLSKGERFTMTPDLGSSAYDRLQVEPVSMEFEVVGRVDVFSADVYRCKRVSELTPQAQTVLDFLVQHALYRTMPLPGEGAGPVAGDLAA